MNDAPPPLYNAAIAALADASNTVMIHQQRGRSVEPMQLTPASRAVQPVMPMATILHNASSPALIHLAPMRKDSSHNGSSSVNSSINSSSGVYTTGSADTSVSNMDPHAEMMVRRYIRHQPNYGQLGRSDTCDGNQHLAYQQQAAIQMLNNGKSDEHLAYASTSQQVQNNHKRASTDPMEIIDVLRYDNERLAERVRQLLQKNVRVHELEMNCQRIQNQYEQMVATQSRREELHKTYELKMQDQLNQVLARNQMLQSRMCNDHSMQSIQQENNQLHTLVAQLMSQSQQLQTVRDRQSLECQSHQCSMDEQRQHIQMLNRALHNAQSKQTRISENSERLRHLCDEQQEAHKQMRAREKQLVTDIAKLQKDKAHLNLARMRDTTTGAFISVGETDAIVVELRRQLDECQEQIAKLTEAKLDCERRATARSQQIQEENADTLKKLQSQLDQSNDERLQLLSKLSDLQSASDQHSLAMDELKRTNHRLLDKCEKMQIGVMEREAMIGVLKKQTGQSASSSIYNLHHQRSLSSTAENPPHLNWRQPYDSASLMRSSEAHRPTSAVFPGVEKSPMMMTHDRLHALTRPQRRSHSSDAQSFMRTHNGLESETMNSIPKTNMKMGEKPCKSKMATIVSMRVNDTD